MTLHDWIDELCDVLDIDAEIDEGIILDLARDAAHSVERPAAPITTYLLGYAAALAGGSPEKVEGSPPARPSWPRSGAARRTTSTRSRWRSRRSTRPWSTSTDPWAPGLARRWASVAVMRAVIATEPGGPEVLTVTQLDDPVPAAGEVVIDVVGTAVNRADTLQRQGFYPPPKGASDVLGLECSGRISAVGPEVERWQVGDEVCALLAGGGYAEKVSVPAGQVMPVPEGIDLVTAGSLPEVACTVWSNVFMVAGLRAGETLLVHGGAGGIGTMAIQLAHALGARVAVTAGSAEKLELCRSLGAAVTINYREQDFVEEIRSATEGRGADVILDNMGAGYLGRNVDALATEGRLVIIGMQGGTKAELDIGKLLRKRGTVVATSLRARPVEEKSAICAAVVEHVWPLVADGRSSRSCTPRSRWSGPARPTG